MIAFPPTSRERIKEYLTCPVKMGGSIGYAYSLTKNSDNAKDLVQEAIFKAWKSAESYDSNVEIKTWFYTIIRNTFLDELKKRKFRKEDQIVRDREVLEQIPTDCDPVEILMARERTESVRKAIENLALPYRIRIVMHDFEGISYEEIAIILGNSRNDASHKVKEAREKLRQDKNLASLVA